jgi:hypothetical protein
MGSGPNTVAKWFWPGRYYCGMSTPPWKRTLISMTNLAYRQPESRQGSTFGRAWALAEVRSDAASQ